MQPAFQLTFIKPQLKVLTYYKDLHKQGILELKIRNSKILILRPCQKIPNTVHLD